jgi:phosphopantothenoylcysteine decarboxylase/phosphopantothenate--cysteine ligase
LIPVLQGKHVVLGVTGSIACYKAVDLASKLTQAGALVDVVMTEDACRFVAPLAFGSITHRPVTTSLFDPHSELSVEHVALADRADILAVAPATANTLAKMSLGLTDNALVATYAATAAPVLVAPAMDGHMYENAAIQENLSRLKARGVCVVGPDSGYLASGKVGAGRMSDPEEILGHVRAMLGRDGALAGKRVVVSAGGTREPLDPVRIITNRSTGKMGHALAEAARDMGASVTLVSASETLKAPPAVETVRVQTALEMQQAIEAACRGADALIMAAAVSDYRAAASSPHKLKKTGQPVSVTMVQNPDILAGIEGPSVRVGFAAESQDLLENARGKLLAKRLDMIVANDITEADSGFGVDTNRAVILTADGEVQRLPLTSKQELAHRVLEFVEGLLTAKGG